MSRRYGRNQRRRARERIAELEAEMFRIQAIRIQLLAEKYILLERIHALENPKQKVQL